MSENENGQNLDLARILQTLANLPKVPNPPVDAQQQSYEPEFPLAVQPGSLPATHYPAQTGIPYGHDQSLDPRLSQRPAPPNRRTSLQDRTSTPLIDPATITEWKHGLRCVNKIATQNPNFIPSIQKLMKDQERNIKDWEAGRQRLIDDQAAKRENEKTHRAALSLPGLGNIAPLRTPEREQEELAQYDQKVYRACRAMAESQSAQLKSLGVPFFKVKPGLVLPDGAEPTEETEDSQETSRKVTKKQLLELQRKMLNHLMEMYGD